MTTAELRAKIRAEHKATLEGVIEDIVCALYEDPFADPDEWPRLDPHRSFTVADLDEIIAILAGVGLVPL